MRIWVALIVGLAIGACVAQKSAVAPSNKGEITALWTQIRDWRREAGLRVEPSAESMLEMRNRNLKEAQRVCPDTHPITKQCEDICSLADAICDNAEAICEIANKLGKDDHQAQEKCTSAKASCKELRREPRFLEEHPHERDVARMLAQHPLEHDVPLHRTDADAARQKNLRHATRR